MPASTNPVSASFTSGSDNAFENFSSEVTFFFPGQGAQHVGMGVETAEKYPKAKELYDRASKILGYDLLQLCKHGPKEKLDRTEICQPATFVHSMAAIERLRAEKGDDVVNSATLALGLSLGEYSALCYTGAISFEDGVRITKERGAAMQAASEKEETGMISVIGLTVGDVERMLIEVEKRCGAKMVIANFLCSGNYVVSGCAKGCKMVEEIAKPQFGARLTVKLAVAGAFHTSYMESAMEQLTKVISNIKIQKPRIPVISNVDARPHSDPDVIREILKAQVVSPVLWEASMKEVLSHGYSNSYELGPGMVLKGIMAKMDMAKGKTVTLIN